MSPFSRVPASTRRARRVVSAFGAVALVGLGATGCGGDDGASARSDPSQVSAGTTPEQRQVSDAEVTAGLTAMKPLVAAAAAGTGSADPGAAFDPIEEEWRTFEGTVRTKEQDLYLAIEDGFAALQQALADKDAAAAVEAQQAIDDAADQYLAKHP